jgi:hypothetical protein
MHAFPTRDHITQYSTAQHSTTPFLLSHVCTYVEFATSQQTAEWLCITRFLDMVDGRFPMILSWRVTKKCLDLRARFFFDWLARDIGADLYYQDACCVSRVHKFGQIHTYLQLVY